MANIERFYSGHRRGVPFAIYSLVFALLRSTSDRVASLITRNGVASIGSRSIVQGGCIMRYPGQIWIGEDVNIGRNCRLVSELHNGYFKIGDRSQINEDCNIDFSGGVDIGRNVVISARSLIYSHSHGRDPHSTPRAISKRIHDNVWIGAGAMILENVIEIGEGAIVAAGAVVTKNVPAYSLVAGNPATVIN